MLFQHQTQQNKQLKFNKFELCKSYFSIPCSVHIWEQLFDFNQQKYVQSGNLQYLKKREECTQKNGIPEKWNL